MLLLPRAAAAAAAGHAARSRPHATSRASPPAAAPPPRCAVRRQLPVLALRWRHARASPRGASAHVAGCPARCSAAAADALPECYSLERAVLLAGFAFEAYRDPVGGTRDVDAAGGATAYLSAFVAECYAGVLEVELQDARELAAGDITGQSDPYCVVSVGDSAWTSGVRRFTRSPTWRETGRLFVRDPAAAGAALRIRVMDEDALKDDDTLGVAGAPLAPLCDGARHELELPVQGGGAGPGGGTVRLAVRFRAFAPPPLVTAAAALSEGIAAAQAALPAMMPAALADAIPAPAARAAGMLGSAASAAASALAGAAASALADAERRRSEKALWAVPSDGDWALLASQPTSGPQPALPHEFEKVCFVSNDRTDTQCAVWRAKARRAIVVAFRGTETAKLRDLITDARLVQRSYSVERASGGDARGAAIHDGFLEAFDSVRARVLAAVDDARGAGPRARALGGGNADDGEWHIYVTGHSLGGALATLCAAELAASGRRGIRVSMVNFGSPRVGNAAFVEAYNSLVPDSIRVVNGADAVPTVPALLGYRHVAHGVRVDAAGAACRDAPPAAVQPGVAAGIAQLAAAAMGGGGPVDTQAAAEAAVALASIVDAAALEAHFEDNYLSALRAAITSSNSTRGE